MKHKTIKPNIFFDLDGTLTDPAEGITNAVAYSLNTYGIRVEDKKTLHKFIGPPLAESFSRYYGFDEAKAAEAVNRYREYYGATGLFLNYVYPGIPNLLTRLRAAGATLAVATSKPAVFSERILKRFSLDGYFGFLSGSELDGTRVKKDEVIAYALEKMKLSPDDVVMVGDRKHDIIGAKRNGVKSVGVLYGYGDIAELEDAGADYIAADVSELSGLLLTDNND